MKFLLIVCTFWISMRFDPCQGAKFHKTWMDCPSGEHRYVKVTCEDGNCDPSDIKISYKSGNALVFGRLTHNIISSKFCGPKCFCKSADGDISAKERNCKKKKIKFQDQAINFVVKCESATKNLKLEFEVNGKCEACDSPAPAPGPGPAPGPAPKPTRHKLSKSFKSCKKNEFKSVQVTCYDNCDPSAKIRYDKGDAHLIGRLGNKIQNSDRCAKNCFCKSGAAKKKQKVCVKKDDVTITDAKVNFVMKCVKATTNLRIDLEVNGKLGDLPLPLKPTKPPTTTMKKVSTTTKPTCAITSTPKLPPTQPENIHELNLGDLFPGTEVYYVAECSGRCDYERLWAYYGHGGDVDLFLKSNSPFRGGEKCSSNMCICGGTGSHPTMETCTRFGRVNVDKLYITVRSVLYSTNVKVKIGGTNIKSVKEYKPKGGADSGIKVINIGKMKKGTKKVYTFKCNGPCIFHSLLSKHKRGGDVDLYGAAKRYKGGIKCYFQQCTCAGSSTDPTREYCHLLKQNTLETIVLTVVAHMDSEDVELCYKFKNLESVDP